MNATGPVFQNAAVRHHHAASHTAAPNIAKPDTDDVVKAAPVKVPDLSPGQFLDKRA